jgi:hypothetical protein
MAILRELIVRYVSWVQMGGVRASLAGMEHLTREDTYDIDEEDEEDTWDFGGEEGREDMGMVVERMGDEPPNSLDARAAISNVRPPKCSYLTLLLLPYRPALTQEGQPNTHRQFREIIPFFDFSTPSRTLMRTRPRNNPSSPRYQLAPPPKRFDL